MKTSTRENLELASLAAFEQVVVELQIAESHRGYAGTNRFDAGLDIVGQQRFQYGDLRVPLPDRIVVVEVESGGGLTNLVKYWPLANAATVPILLLHAFGQSSVNDYLSHLLLWDFVYGKMRADLERDKPPVFFARAFRFTAADHGGLADAVNAFRACLTLPLAEGLTTVFSRTQDISKL